MHHRQRGIALIEILGVLLIAGMLLAGVVSMIDTSLEDTKAQQAALYQSQMATAATRYLSDNYPAIAVAANLGQTLVYPLGTLQAAGVLPPGMSVANPYGQTPCLLVRPRQKLASDSIVLDALVVTEGAKAQAIPERILAFAAANAGVGGGFISSRNPTQAQGSSGAWTLSAATTPSLASFTAAHCAVAAAAGSLASLLYFDGPGQAADFLYRDKVAGMPELNQMNTPVAMGAGATVNAGDACGGAAIAVDAQRDVMNCGADNTWHQVASVTSWKAPVVNFGDLPMAGDTKEGDVRMVTALGRAFTYMPVPPFAPPSDGSPLQPAWVALAVDQNNNMTVPGLTHTGTLISDDFIWAATYSIGSHYNAGEGCNGFKPGTNTRVNIIGTIVLDSNPDPLPLVCVGNTPDDAVWMYINGTLER
jgi:type II secretory pathway pseudopilin PulG